MPNASTYHAKTINTQNDSANSENTPRYLDENTSQNTTLSVTNIFNAIGSYPTCSTLQQQPATSTTNVINQFPPNQTSSIMQNISPDEAPTIHDQNFYLPYNNSRGVAALFDRNCVVGDEQMMCVKQTDSPYTFSSTQERSSVKFDRRKRIPTPRYRNINKNNRGHKGIQIKEPEPQPRYNNQGLLSLQKESIPESSGPIYCDSASSTAATNLPSTSNSSPFYSQRNGSSMAVTNVPSTSDSSPVYTEGVSHYYIDIGDCQYVCQYCKAMFWYGERVKTGSRWQPIRYNKCCGGGQVYLHKELDPPRFFKEIFKDKHFLENLYNVVGNREYQLPSSGTLGAIVFESGSNTQTDYDVIIEYKDRQPQRINKLHTSYMSLQYPLLFVYGQPGYHTKMTLKGVNAKKKRNKLMAESSITPMEPQAKQKILEVKANIKDLKPKDRDKVLEAKIYRAWMAREPPDTTEKGCREADTIGDPNKDQMVMRKVEIQNLNRNSVELTLWDDLAETFQKEEIDKLEKPVIIAVTSCRVSKYYNKLQLSSTPATYYYINPKIPQLEQYQAEYRELLNLNPPLEIVRHSYQDIEKEKMRNRFPLAELLTKTPKTYEGVRFTCEGNITSIQTSKDWYYPSCTTCIQKVQENDGVFDCRAHGPLEKPSYRYNFKGNLTDNTATATMTFFTPKADKIVGIDCNSLMAELNYPGPRDIPQRLHAITGKNHIFQFNFNTSTKQGTPEFIFHRTLDGPLSTTEVQHKASGSATPQQSSMALTTNIPDEDELLAIMNYTPLATQNVVTNFQSIKTSLFTTGQTPPQIEPDFSNQPLKAQEQESSRSASAKRILFEEKAKDAKKTKKE
ncbi:replication protein A 70 kDa DNA-binding subunit [Artemisia annua]|uniref:Replication protein A 70 kDa DNA-binding subunit n=1 Tax=Artemisia annua TaxID=35608 RepID=A0A2U1NQC4_ARTAN|nr:replication protein A 70 kDa DNA-binding subunit [Artemisia annua]